MAMQALETMASVLQRIREDMPDLIAEVLEENKTLIEDMNIAQLDKGERSDGSLLPNYSPVSVAKYGKKPGPMTLEDTGRFKRGITLKVSKTFAEIIGTDPKTGMLEARYDLTIIGISEENRDEVVTNILLPGLREKIRIRYLSK